MPRVWTVFLLLVLSSGIGHAQQSACLERTIPVSISSDDGSQTPELTAASLEGTYDKKPVIVKSAQPAKTPPRVILLVDTSGSMRNLAGPSVDSAEAVVSRLPKDFPIGLAFFGSGTVPVVLPTMDRAEVTIQLEALRKHGRTFRGKTAIWSALQESVKMLGTPMPGDVIYLISDGGENASKAKESDIEKEFGSSGVRLFALLLKHVMPTPQNVGEDAGSILRDVAVPTGGTVIVQSELGPEFPVSEREMFVDKHGKPTLLEQILNRQVNQLRDFYLVEITLPESAERSRSWKLDLHGTNSSNRHGLTLSYPTRVWSCH